MTTRQIAHLVRIPDRDREARFRRLLNADTRRTQAPRGTRDRLRSLHRRRCPPTRAIGVLILVVVDPVRVRLPCLLLLLLLRLLLRLRRLAGLTLHGRAHRQRRGQGRRRGAGDLLLRGHGRRTLGEGGIRCAEGPEGVVLDCL